HIVVFCNRKGEYFAQPRPGNFLGGLYHFVEADSTAQSVNFQNRRYALAKGRTLGHIRQSYSHFTLEGTVRVIEGAAGKGPWYSPSELKQLPMSMAERKVLALLEVA